MNEVSKAYTSVHDFVYTVNHIYMNEVNKADDSVQDLSTPLDTSK